MMYIYIATVTVMLALIIFTSMAILTVTKTTCQNIKKKTLELASLYDYLLEEHSQELKNKKRLMEQIGFEAAGMSTPKEEAVQTESKVVTTPNIASTMTTVENIGKANYLSPQIATVYQEIRGNFGMDLTTLKEKFPVIEQEQEVGLATKLLSILSYETIYAMSFLTEEEQLACMKEALEDEYQGMLASFMENREAFSSLDFYGYIRELEEQEHKKAKIYISPNVATTDLGSLDVEVKDDICEGIQIEMNHALYDFAIEKKEIGWVCQH